MTRPLAFGESRLHLVAGVSFSSTQEAYVPSALHEVICLSSSVIDLIASVPPPAFWLTVSFVWKCSDPEGLVLSPRKRDEALQSAGEDRSHTALGVGVEVPSCVEHR